MIFPEAVTELDITGSLPQRCTCPILANMTEFGVTPLYTVEELAGLTFPWCFIRSPHFGR